MNAMGIVRLFQKQLGRRAAFWGLCLLFGGCIAGCRQPQTLLSDPNQAKTILSETLAAWVQGQSPDEQSTKNPPIYVADEKWLGGGKLVSYDIQGEGEVYGSSIRFPVTLQFAEGSDPREVFYLVSTKPAISVALGD